MSKVIWNKVEIRDRKVCDIKSGTIFTWGKCEDWILRAQGNNYYLDSGLMSAIREDQVLDNYLEAKAIEIKGTK